MTVSKVVAGAGAAATSAVAGSIFGADGTVVGAAVGSVVSAVTAAAYERSLDRTTKVVVSRVRLPGGHTAEVTQVLPAADATATQGIDDAATQVIPAQRRAAGLPPAPTVAPVPQARRTRLPLLVGATALIFLVGLLVVTGVELLAGGPVLSSQKGTSVGRVLGYSPSTADPTTTVDPTAAAPTSEATATNSSAAPTTARRAEPAAPASGSAADGSAPRTKSGRVKETPAPASHASPGNN